MPNRMIDIPHLKPDGERLTTDFEGEIVAEHLHRYAIAKQFVKGKDVLDIASGEGYGCNYLAFSAKSVTGVDISEQAVRHSSTKYTGTGLKFIQGSCVAIPIGNQSVDVVVSFETIEHIHEHELFLIEIKRVLRPNGVLIISSPDKKNYSDKQNYKNPYHKKELYHSQFCALIELHFKHSKFAKQSFVNGSFIENSVPTRSSLIIGDYVQSECFNFESEAPFSIAIASDNKLPTLGNSIFKSTCRPPIKNQACAQLFASSIETFSEKSRSIEIKYALNETATIYFQKVHELLKPGTVNLRLDPSCSLGETTLEEISIKLEGTNETLVEFPLKSINLSPSNNVIKVSGEGYKLIATSDDPQIFLPSFEWDGHTEWGVMVKLKTRQNANAISSLIKGQLEEINMHKEKNNSLYSDLKKREQITNSLQHDLEKREQQNISLQRDLKNATDKVKRIQNSFSWKATSPIRAIRRKICP